MYFYFAIFEAEIYIVYAKFIHLSNSIFFIITENELNSCFAVLHQWVAKNDTKCVLLVGNVVFCSCSFDAAALFIWLSAGCQTIIVPIVLLTNISITQMAVCAKHILCFLQLLLWCCRAFVMIFCWLSKNYSTICSSHPYINHSSGCFRQTWVYIKTLTTNMTIILSVRQNKMRSLRAFSYPIILKLVLLCLVSITNLLWYSCSVIYAAS